MTLRLITGLDNIATAHVLLTKALHVAARRAGCAAPCLTHPTLDESLLLLQVLSTQALRIAARFVRFPAQSPR
jgi:hypothetical protein